MDTLSSLCYTASMCSLFNHRSVRSDPAATSRSTALNNASDSACVDNLCVSSTPRNASITSKNGYTMSKSKMKKRPMKSTQAIPLPTLARVTGKRKRSKLKDNVKVCRSPTATRRKASTDYLRKGQWTSTEERLARLLIEAFEEGYLPIYTGIRLRGYLAVQLQCDPMRVSKKLCAGTIDGKLMPKNYGQKKFKLRKKNVWDADEAACRLTELESFTRAMWTEARLRKPPYLTLSCTRNINLKKGSDDESDSGASPTSPVQSCFSSTPLRSKKQKKFPIIYLNLSKLKHYSDSIDNSDGDPAISVKESDSDEEPVRLDGESLQAAYDLLTLCSPRGSASTDKTKKGKAKKNARTRGTQAEMVDNVTTDPLNKDESCDSTSSEDQVSEHKIDENNSNQGASSDSEHVSTISIGEVKSEAPVTMDILTDKACMDITTSQ